MRCRALTTLMTCMLVVAGAAVGRADASPGGAPPAATGPAAPAPAPTTPRTGGREYGTPAPEDTPTVPGPVAQIVDGVAYAPADAPDAVKQVIWAANRIVGLPYKYGGGHAAGFEDDGYDCSGTVSFALHGGDLLSRPMDSSTFARWGASGTGSWITVYTNPGHAYMTVAGIRLDTSAADDPSGRKGPQWRALRRSNRGFRRRHPIGL